MGTRSTREMEHIFPEDWYNLVLDNVPANMGRGNGRRSETIKLRDLFKEAGVFNRQVRAKGAALPNNLLVSLIAVEATIHSICPGVPLTMNLAAQL